MPAKHGETYFDAERQRIEPSAPPAPIAAEALGDELQAALDALQPEWREALWLREVEELSYEEIARVQQCPPGTVRSRLARARAKLIEKLQQTEGHVGHGRV